ncbi:MAG: hypothetical protein RLY31_2080, partial [Bacteroidota bacterium]
AMQGLGLGTESWSNAAEDVSRTSVFWPDRASAAAYQESSERFAQLFSRLRSVPDSTPTQSGTDKTNKY